MEAIKCKMCGANLVFGAGSTICTCEFCGSEQVLPDFKSEKIESLRERAGRYRMNYEFDKARELYELILEEDNTDPEVYWSLFLCNYGIVYVKDEETSKYIPTMNRASYGFIANDKDYLAAMEKSDDEKRRVYEANAGEIAEIQNRILSISRRESPFDVFICYKETDDSGRRTQDSVLANNIYHQLDKDGIKTFFARVTLEDKLGTEYEPYIFAALNSAKVMLCIGSDPEYFEAVWVKNEWSRYIALMEKDTGKVLIPIYKDMDAYELPKEFSHLQALDADKLGFMQDLLRGVKKILGIDENGEGGSDKTATDDKKMYLACAKGCIANGDWKNADDLYEKILNVDCECAEAYIGKAFIRNRVKDLSELEAKIMAASTKRTLFRPEDYTIKGYNELTQEEIEVINKWNACNIDASGIRKEFEKYDLKRALKYSDGYLKARLTDIYNKTTIEISAEEKENVKAKLKEMSDRAMKFRNARNNDYDEAVRTFLNYRNTSVGVLEETHQKLLNMGNYRDAGKYAAKLNQLIVYNRQYNSYPQNFSTAIVSDRAKKNQTQNNVNDESDYPIPKPSGRVEKNETDTQRIVITIVGAVIIFIIQVLAALAK